MLWGLVLPLIVYAVRAIGIVTQPDIPFDTLHTYLPLARQWMENASALMLNPESLKVAPGTGVYMALAGADPTTIKASNLTISLAAISLVFDAARRIGGNLAGAAAKRADAKPEPAAAGPKSESPKPEAAKPAAKPAS